MELPKTFALDSRDTLGGQRDCYDFVIFSKIILRMITAFFEVASRSVAIEFCEDNGHVIAKVFATSAFQSFDGI